MMYLFKAYHGNPKQINILHPQTFLPKAPSTPKPPRSPKKFAKIPENLPKSAGNHGRLRRSVIAEPIALVGFRISYHLGWEN
eukprot:1385878-Amorphochlora_amoeboformis.AAC.1